MQNNTLPNGFISVPDAIALINSDTRSDAKVDIQRMLNNLPYLKVGGNFTIFKLKHKDGRVVDDGVTYVQIVNDFDRVSLAKAIQDHYTELSGQMIDPTAIGIRSMTTTIDDDDAQSGRVRKNEAPMTKTGDSLGSGSKTVNQ